MVCFVNSQEPLPCEGIVKVERRTRRARLARSRSSNTLTSGTERTIAAANSRSRQKGCVHTCEPKLTSSRIVGSVVDEDEGLEAGMTVCHVRMATAGSLA